MKTNVNWSKVWSSKYPILKQYKDVVDVKQYSTVIRSLLDEISKDYELSAEDSMLVLKDILYHEYMDHKK